MVTTKFVLRKSKVRKNGEMPLVLRITKNREHSYYSICHLDLKSWDEKRERVRSSYPNCNRLNDKLLQLKSKAQNIYFGFEESGKYYRAKDITYILKNKSNLDLIDYGYKWILERLSTKEISYSTSVKYKGIIDKLDTFSKGELPLNRFDEKFLKQYELYLLNTIKNKINTVNSNLKCLKAIVGKLIKEGHIKYENSPFINYKFKFEDSQRQFLSSEQIEKIRSLQLNPNTKIYDCQQIFLFCVETGLRIGDALKLVRENFDGETIYYISEKNRKVVNTPLTKTAIAILESQLDKNYNYTNYAFRFLDSQLQINDKTALRDKKLQTAIINKNLKIIAERSGLDRSISTHIARHSLATNALSNGLNYAEIQSLLNHTSVKTTQIYAKLHDGFKISAIEKLNRC